MNDNGQDPKLLVRENFVGQDCCIVMFPSNTGGAIEAPLADADHDGAYEFSAQYLARTLLTVDPEVSAVTAANPDSRYRWLDNPINCETLAADFVAHGVDPRPNPSNCLIDVRPPNTSLGAGTNPQSWSRFGSLALRSTGFPYPPSPATYLDFAAGSVADGDGIPTAVEDLTPPAPSCPTCLAGDGNGDHVADSTQANVTSLPSEGPGQPYVTVESPPGTMPDNVTAVDPTTLSPPTGVTFPAGLVDFTVSGVTPGATILVKLYVQGALPTQYWKYQGGVWSNYTSHTNLTANPIVINLQDKTGGQAGFGDDDATPGVIHDPSGPAAPARSLTALSDAHVWVGLKNSDDQGTNFDIRVQLLQNGVPVVSRVSRCVSGVVRNPTLAKDALVGWGSFSAVPLSSGDVLALQVSTRIGTKADESKCAGHNSAAGLRLYYDADSRRSRFDATIAPDPNADQYLVSNGNACKDAESTGVTIAEPERDGVVRRGREVQGLGRGELLGRQPVEGSRYLEPGSPAVAAAQRVLGEAIAHRSAALEILLRQVRMPGRAFPHAAGAHRAALGVLRCAERLACIGAGRGERALEVADPPRRVVGSLPRGCVRARSASTASSSAARSDARATSSVASARRRASSSGGGAGFSRARFPAGALVDADAPAPEVGAAPRPKPLGRRNSFSSHPDVTVGWTVGSIDAASHVASIASRWVSGFGLSVPAKRSAVSVSSSINARRRRPASRMSFPPVAPDRPSPAANSRATRDGSVRAA